MARPPRDRILATELPAQRFRPLRSPGVNADEIVLTFDEAESLRLADLEGLYQHAASVRMGVSRTTFGRIVASARRKTADALLHGKRLRIEGGPVVVGASPGVNLKIAVPTGPSGLVEEHFGRCNTIAVFTIDKGCSITGLEMLDASIGPGCKSRVFAALADVGVTALVAGCIGDGAIRIGASHGIAIVRGASGEARSAAARFARGELKDSGLKCGRACMGSYPQCR